MCGFVGFFDLSGRMDKLDIEDIRKGSDAIKHRGPDSSSIYQDDHFCVGFQRLSIIDLKAPNPPYFSEDGTICIVCNGEIYNYRELKQILLSKNYQFKTDTDTEIIAHGFKEWGNKLWAKMNGIFAVAMWDKSTKQLFLARDHMGVKPLHYFVKDSRVYFSSDFNALLKQTKIVAEVNNEAILSYLSFRYVIGEQTFYKGIYNVLPGNYIEYSDFKLKQNVYWDLPIDEDEDDKGEKYYLDKLDELFNNAIERQLMSDVPVGAFISGGLDSSLLLYYMNKHKKNIKTYITGFDVDGYNEFYYADLMANSLGITPTKITIDPNEYMNNMEEVIAFRGEPVSIPHEAAFLKMSRRMKKDITVVLSGEGADELFGGYGRIFRSPFDYYKQKMITDKGGFFSPLLKSVFQISEDQLYNNPMNHFLSRYSWFTEKDKNKLLNLEFFGNKYFDDYSLKYMSSLFDKTADKSYYRAMYYIQSKIHLPNLLNRLDRMTMAASVEGRVPFLDIELVEFVSRMPMKYKLKWKNKFSKASSLFSNSEKISERKDVPKYILKKLAEGKIPNEIIWRKKMGFPVPLNEWMGKKMKNYASDLLLSSDTRIKDMINTEGIKDALNYKKFNSQYDYEGKRIWMLINLELWIRKYFPSSS